VLAKQLTARTIHRQYVACVSGLLDVDEGTVDVALMRHTHDRRRVVVCGLEDGRHAVTHYRVRHRMTTPDRALQVGPYTVIECTLETGRTHQVRVHMQHLGHPVLGDALYGTQRGRLARHLLHAEQLTFIHPRSSAPMRLRAPVPADMATFVQMK
jgi:23S rRNA pseudouridine1911/1915/1917 synthase